VREHARAIWLAWFGILAGLWFDWGVPLGCASVSVERVEDAGSDSAPPSQPPANEPSRTSPTDPCGRIEVLRFDGGAFFYSLPCRRFDPLKDSPRPLP